MASPFLMEGDTAIGVKGNVGPLGLWTVWIRDRSFLVWTLPPTVAPKDPRSGPPRRVRPRSVQRLQRRYGHGRGEEALRVFGEVLVITPERCTSRLG